MADKCGPQIHILKLITADSSTLRGVYCQKEDNYRVFMSSVHSKFFDKFQMKKSVERFLHFFVNVQIEPKITISQFIYYLRQPQSPRSRSTLWLPLCRKLFLGLGKQFAKFHHHIFLIHEDN